MKKIILIVALSLIEVTAHSQIQPDTTNADGLISAIAAKFCDVYSRDPSRESTFNFGSSAMEDYKKRGIEEIRIICLDGFVKTFWMSPRTERKIVRIEDLSTTKGVIYYSDGSESTSELFFCPARPVAYQIIKKR